MFRIFSILVIGLLTSHAAWSQTPIYTGFFSSTAIRGYDTVAYFTQAQAVEGKAQFSYAWNGADWHFSSAENRDSFAAAPEKYAPQYGGYCAYALALKNDLVKVDPTAWSIVEGKLYLNYNRDIQHQWETDRDNYISRSDANWPSHIK